jgi:anaerobic selenocysteine-containing dehydrogenase
VKDSQPIEVTSPRGSFVAPVKVSDKIQRGFVFVPTNFPDLGVYRLFEENTTICRVKLKPIAERAAG